MKRGTPDHPKTLALAAELELDIASTMGILEMLCSHFAPAYCPRGDIGKWSDQEITQGLKTSVPAERLIPALLRTRWLDTHARHRFVIHDWAEHCDNGVRLRLKHQGGAFVSRRSRGHPEDGLSPTRHGSGTGTGSGSGSSPSDLLPDSGSGAAIVPSPNGDGDGFPVLWAAYPRKVGKQAARREWERLTPDATLLARMLETIRWQRLQTDWLKDEGRFIPYPATWLRQRRWEDEPVDMPMMSQTEAHNLRAAAEAIRRHRKEELLE